MGGAGTIDAGDRGHTEPLSSVFSPAHKYNINTGGESERMSREGIGIVLANIGGISFSSSYTV